MSWRLAHGPVWWRQVLSRAFPGDSSSCQVSRNTQRNFTWHLNVITDPSETSMGPPTSSVLQKAVSEVEPFQRSLSKHCSVCLFMEHAMAPGQSENSLPSLASPSILRLHHVSPWKRLGFFSLAVSFLLSSQADQRICCCICFCMMCGGWCLCRDTRV